jgi:hypothetical protein
MTHPILEKMLGPQTEDLDHGPDFNKTIDRVAEFLWPYLTKRLQIEETLTVMCEIYDEILEIVQEFEGDDVPKAGAEAFSVDLAKAVTLRGAEAETARKAIVEQAYNLMLEGKTNGRIRLELNLSDDKRSLLINLRNKFKKDQEEVKRSIIERIYGLMWAGKTDRQIWIAVRQELGLEDSRRHLVTDTRAKFIKDQEQAT